MQISPQDVRPRRTLQLAPPDYPRRAARPSACPLRRRAHSTSRMTGRSDRERACPCTWVQTGLLLAFPRDCTSSPLALRLFCWNQLSRVTSLCACEGRPRRSLSTVFPSLRPDAALFTSRFKCCSWPCPPRAGSLSNGLRYAGRLRFLWLDPPRLFPRLLLSVGRGGAATRHPPKGVRGGEACFAVAHDWWTSVRHSLAALPPNSRGASFPPLRGLRSAHLGQSPHP